MARHIELNPVSHLTIGTIGEPGQRTFYLQGSRGTNLVSLVIEKQQAAMLAASLESLIEEVERRFPSDEERDAVWTDMRLREPIEPLFRVGNMGLGYNEEVGRIVVVAYELVEEDEEPNVVSFWATRVQAQALVKHAYEAIRAGRPICGNCGQPIDASGHFCPNRNGHATHVT
ncbi:MAG: DUF3090 domain-containing protein [Chloroflexi bacterium]|nr:DUF3090 domain-containing protein [Chloroflexota bacterium]MCI0578438.1 DUF3090 domain-containing protein [Chloroflexota bacterium]MCI0643884.1 DUF3090 domain-containing protein [Chloroflexota bacterium]MCI0729206.1 DUF3090 domain-containing protein [Chloroflexota bacterium]